MFTIYRPYCSLELVTLDANTLYSNGVLTNKEIEVLKWVL